MQEITTEEGALCQGLFPEKKSLRIQSEICLVENIGFDKIYHTVSKNSLFKNQMKYNYSPKFIVVVLFLYWYPYGGFLTWIEESQLFVSQQEASYFQFYLLFCSTNLILLR